MKLDKFKIFDGSVLKLIAVLSMLIDHSALILSPALAVIQMPLFTVFGKNLTLYYIMRKIGRLAFPIFAFLATEGYVHTKSPKKYALRLLLFAVISEIPFNLMVGGRVFYSGKQSVYVTLFLGILLIHIFETLREEFKKFAAMFLVLVCAFFLRADYGVAGACLILLLYILRNHTAAQTVLAYPLLSGGVAAFAAFLPIRLYNGRRGFIRTPVLAYSFYLFYPVHMLLLIALRQALLQ